MTSVDAPDLESGTIIASQELEWGWLLALQELQHDPTLKLARDLWQSREAELEKAIENHESRVSNLTNEIFHLLGFATVLQVLLLTAVAQATQLKCHNVGIPLALSLFATVVTLAGVWQKKGIITRLKRTLSTEKRVRKAYMRRVQILEKKGKNFKFTDLPQHAIEEPAGIAGTCSSSWATYYNAVVVCILLLGGICSVFIYRVLCDA